MDSGTASIVAALIAAFSGIVVAYIHSVRTNVKRVENHIDKVGQDNRTDHAYVVRKLTAVAETLHEVKLDTKDMKEDLSVVKKDIRELKRQDREHDEELSEHLNRLNDLERNINNSGE
jgi:septal ring factor EnvC (AmiA/AmiB activator)